MDKAAVEGSEVSDERAMDVDERYVVLRYEGEYLRSGQSQSAQRTVWPLSQDTKWDFPLRPLWPRARPRPWLSSLAFFLVALLLPREPGSALPSQMWGERA